MWFLRIRIGFNSIADFDVYYEVSVTDYTCSQKNENMYVL